MSERKIETDDSVRPNVIERLIEESTKQTIENDCAAKPRMVANNWLTKHENNYDHLQYQTRSRIGESSGLGARDLETSGAL